MRGGGGGAGKPTDPPCSPRGTVEEESTAPSRHPASGYPSSDLPIAAQRVPLPNWTHFCPCLSHAVKSVFLLFNSVAVLSVELVKTAKEKCGAVYGETVRNPPEAHLPYREDQAEVHLTPTPRPLGYWLGPKQGLITQDPIRHQT